MKDSANSKLSEDFFSLYRQDEKSMSIEKQFIVQEIILFIKDS